LNWATVEQEQQRGAFCCQDVCVCAYRHHTEEMETRCCKQFVEHSVLCRYDVPTQTVEELDVDLGVLRQCARPSIHSQVILRKSLQD